MRIKKFTRPRSKRRRFTFESMGGGENLKSVLGTRNKFPDQNANFSIVLGDVGRWNVFAAGMNDLFVFLVVVLIVQITKRLLQFPRHDVEVNSALWQWPLEGDVCRVDCSLDDVDGIWFCVQNHTNLICGQKAVVERDLRTVWVTSRGSVLSTPKLAVLTWIRYLSPGIMSVISASFSFTGGSL